MSRDFPGYLLVYFLGIVAGVAASELLGVQLSRPGLIKSILLIGLALVVAFLVLRANIHLSEWLWYPIWAGVGVMVGLGGGRVAEAGPGEGPGARY